MEKLKHNVNFVLLLTLVVLTAVNVFLYFMDYKFEPINYILFMLLYILIAITATVVSLKFKDSKTRIAKVSGILMPLVALGFIVSLGLVLELNVIYLPQNSLYFEALFLAALSSSIVIFFSTVKRKSIKICMGILTGIASVPFAFILFISLVFSNFGENKVIQSVNSPYGTYNAFVVSSDQGGLGGDTCLYVRNIKKDIFIGIGSFKTEAQLLRFGEWGEEYDLVWKDETTLTANKTEYNIAYILQTNYVDNHRYSAKMRIYIPNRKPDFMEDTHGGFHGDGDCVLQYRLSPNEIERMEKDILNNGNWKAIDDISAKYLYGGIEGYYSDGFTLSKIPKLDDGYFCFYDKQTRSFNYPNKDNYSSNYIVAQYSPNENTLYIFELDT